MACLNYDYAKMEDEPGGGKRRPRRTSREPCWASRGCRFVRTGGGERALSVSSPLVRTVQQVQVRLRYRLPSTTGAVGARAAHCGPARPLRSHCSDTGASIDATAAAAAAAVAAADTDLDTRSPFCCRTKDWWYSCVGDLTAAAVRCVRIASVQY